MKKNFTLNTQQDPTDIFFGSPSQQEQPERTQNREQSEPIKDTQSTKSQESATEKSRKTKQIHIAVTPDFYSRIIAGSRSEEKTTTAYIVNAIRFYMDQK